MRRSQLAGLVVWRLGLLIVAAYGFFRTARRILAFIEIPLQLEIGGGLILAGFGLVIVSLILERLRDYRQEKEVATEP